MDRTYPRLYEALKANGHSPAKARELLLDARRSDCFSLMWVRCIAQVQRDKRARMRAVIRELCAAEGLL